MIEFLRRRDRTLLEMHTGILFVGILCQLGCLLFAGKLGYFSLGLWFGIALAIAASIHMARTLDIALADVTQTEKVMIIGYIVRYALFCVFLVLLKQIDIYASLGAFLGYMSLKFTAYLQPFTHKFYLRLFQETDPEPEDLPDGDLEEIPNEGSTEEETKF